MDSLLGTSMVEELASLSREPDPVLFWEALSNAASRLANEGREAAAASIYDFLLREGGSDLPAGMLRRAREAREALSGRGPLGLRLEATARRFTAEVTSPGPLLGMAAATTVFSLCRLGILSRLWSSSEAAWWSRGFGSRAIAASLALVPEAGTFWLTHKALAEFQQPGRQDWSLGQNLRELRGTLLGLGLLRASGFLSQRLHQGLRGAEALAAAGPSLEAKLVHQAGMFGGILSAHALETHLGWRRPEAPADAVFESLVTLLHFNVAGRISSGAFPSLYGHQRGFELRLRAQEARQMGDWSTSLLSGPESGPGDGSAALAGSAGRRPGANPGRAILFPNTLMMMSTEGPDGKRASSSSGWNWGSVAPPALTGEGQDYNLQTRAEALEWLGRARGRAAGLTHLHSILRWLDIPQRQLFIREALQQFKPEEVIEALAGRLDPELPRAERLASISTLHLLTLEQPTRFAEVNRALGQAAGRFGLDAGAVLAWEGVKGELRCQLDSNASAGADSGGGIREAVLQARQVFASHGSPHPLANELLEGLRSLPGSPANYRKYVLLAAAPLSQNSLPNPDPFDHFLQALFLSERAAESGEWVLGREFLRQGRARLQPGDLPAMGAGAINRLSQDLGAREKALMDTVVNLIGLKDASENPFLRQDPRFQISQVALLRALWQKAQVGRRGAPLGEATSYERFAADLLDREATETWLAQVPEAELRGNLSPAFRELADYVGRRQDGSEPYWPSLLGNISENLVASSNPELAFRVLRDLHLIEVAPPEVFQDVVISQVTNIEIALRQTRDPQRLRNLEALKGRLAQWAQSF
ncbi:MAG: hypothetical protein U1F66_01375 [bacterium]